MKGLILTLLFFNITKVYAYSFTQDFMQGFYWQRFPISISIYVSEQDNSQLLQTLVNQAVNEWEDAVGKELWEIDPELKVGTNFQGSFIRWSNNFAAETGFNPLTTLAVAIRFPEGPYIGRSEIILNGQLDYLRQNFSNSLYKTLLHEFGHIIALDHSEEEAMMAPSIGSYQSLQPDDILGANAVVDETLSRQERCFISDGVRQSQSANASDSGLGTCGSIDLDSSQGPPSGAPFILSLLLGVSLSLSSRIRYLGIK